MTVTHRKRQHQPDEIQIVNEPGLQIQCDACGCDLTHSVRIKCADPVCEPGDGVDICPSCFCKGKEFDKHKRGHAYRVVELHSYPIFSADWGADEELLLLEGVSLQGIGNWQAIAEHVGTRAKDEIEKHYNEVYVDSPDWPLPRMDLSFDIDPSTFQEQKRRRISSLSHQPAPLPKIAPTSAPGSHEIATFLPGRLEFEHEVDNEAEDLVKDLEFGVCLEWGGEDCCLEDELDGDVKGRAKLIEEKKAMCVDGKSRGMSETKSPAPPSINGINGHTNGHSNGDPVKLEKTEDVHMENGTATKQSSGGDENADVDEVTQPPPIESKDSLAFKLMLLEMYAQRVEKRHEAKAVMFERGLLEYKKMQAAEKKRPKDEKDIVHRLRPFARLGSADDYEVFQADILYESMLRKKIQDLQFYRRMGLTTAADIDKYENDVIKRTQAKANMSRDYYSSERLSQLRTVSGRGSSGPDPRRAGSFVNDTESRRSHDRETSPKPSGSNASIIRKPAAPLNLANSPSLHLLTPAEQTLCSQLRILPKPYLVIKETLVREYARRGGKLRRREARDLVKVDVNKTSRVWDFLVQAGFLQIGTEPQPNSNPSGDHSMSGHASLSASPTKDTSRISPRPGSSAPMITPNGFASKFPAASPSAPS